MAVRMRKFAIIVIISAENDWIIESIQCVTLLMIYYTMVTIRKLWNGDVRTLHDWYMSNIIIELSIE